MSNMINKKITILLLGLSFSQAFCIIFNIHEWSNGNNTIYLFSDYHDFDDGCTKKQWYYLPRIAKLLNAFAVVEAMCHPWNLYLLDKESLEVHKKENRLFIAPELNELFDAMVSDFFIRKKPIECAIAYSNGEKTTNISAFDLNDKLDPNKDYSDLIPNNYMQECNAAALSLSNLLFNKLKVPTENIEFRFFYQHRNTSLATSVKIIEKYIHELECYNDDQTLNKYYSSIYTNQMIRKILVLLKSFCKQFSEISLKKFYKDDSIYCSEIDQLFAQLCWSYPWETQKEMRGYSARKKKKGFIFYCIDCGIIEARILHSIYNHKQFKNIFVCAGGKHILNLEQSLANLGFKRIDNFCEGKSSEEMSVLPSPDDAIDIAQHFEKLHNISIDQELVKAVEDKNFDRISQILSWGTDINSINNLARTPPLHFAADNEGLTKFLLQRGALANQKDAKQYTTLHWAAIVGNIPVLKLLMQHGASGVIRQENIYGMTPLMEAIRNKHELAAQYLLEHGAEESLSCTHNWADLPLFYKDKNPRIYHLLMASDWSSYKNYAHPSNGLFSHPQQLTARQRTILRMLEHSPMSEIKIRKKLNEGLLTSAIHGELFKLRCLELIHPQKFGKLKLWVLGRA